MLSSKTYFNHGPASGVRRGAVPALLLAVGFLLSSCGYRPLYGRSSTQPEVVQGMESVEIAVIPNRMGQMLRTALKRRLTPYGPREQARYTLKIQLRESIAKVAINKASFATRANLRVMANFQLFRNRDNKTVSSGQTYAVASYNILTSDFATLAAQTDARKHAVTMLAEEIPTRLAIYFRNPQKNRGQPAVR